MLSAAQTSAGAALLLFGGAVAWLLLADFPVTDLGKATTTASPLMLLEATVPSIGDFNDFNINTENPFIPFNLRPIEIAAIKTAKQPRQPKPPQIPQVETPKPRELPRLPGPTTTGPRATGVLISKDGVQALLTFPGQPKAALMKPGDTTYGWTLIEVIDGNIVRMKEDATGTTHNLVVPESIAVHKAAPKPDATKPDGKKPDGKPPSGKGPNGKSPGEHKNPQQAEDRPVPNMNPPEIVPPTPPKMM